MTRADSSPTTNRREVLAGTAAALAGAAAVNVAAIATAKAAPDERLVELGRRWMAMLPEWHRLNDQNSQCAGTALEEIKRRLDANKATCMSEAEREQRYAADWKVLTETSGWNAADREFENFDNLFASIEDGIIKGRAGKAASVEGLGVVAAIAAFANDGPARSLWAKPAREMDWDQLCVRVLIESALEAAGISLNSIVGDGE